jgi:hypothetical protein
MAIFCRVYLPGIFHRLKIYFWRDVKTCARAPRSKLFAGGMAVKKLVLKYNARVGKDHLPKIEEMTRRLGLKIEKIEESRPGHKRISVTGQSDKLQEMDKALVRFASITRRAA